MPLVTFGEVHATVMVVVVTVMILILLGISGTVVEQQDITILTMSTLTTGTQEDRASHYHLHHTYHYVFSGFALLLTKDIMQ